MSAKIENSMTDHFDTEFLGFPVLKHIVRGRIQTEMIRKFQLAKARFSCNPPDLNLSKLNPSAVKATKLFNLLLT
jgi:hypothetical protein